MEVDICRKESQQAQYPKQKLGWVVVQQLIHPIQPVNNTNLNWLGKAKTEKKYLRSKNFTWTRIILKRPGLSIQFETRTMGLQTLGNANNVMHVSE